MTWSNVGNPISPKSDWQYTDPLSGSFFRLQHSNAPNNAVFQIAQAEIGSDGTVSLFDDRILAVDPENDIILLKSPECFTARRLAVRRLPNPLTLEDELRNALVPGIFRLTSPQPNLIAPIAWSVQIEVSDVVIPSLDLTVITQQLTNITQQLTTIKAKTDLIASSSTSTSSTSTSVTTSNNNQKNLTYVSAGDTNGVFYWIGTQNGTQPFSNPAVSGLITATQSSILADSTKATNLTDRGDAIAHTQNIASSWFEYDLGATRKLLINCYTLKGRHDTDVHSPNNWHLQASNDGSVWTDIDVQTNNSTIQHDAWITIPISNQSTAYRYWRFLQTGPNNQGQDYLVLGEWEFYGTLIAS